MPLAVSENDPGTWDVATLSGRVAYVAMCLSTCWGVLAATGWVRRVTGRSALRATHRVLAAFALAMGVSHALTFLLLRQGPLAAYQLVLPLVGGGEVRHALGVVGLELVLAASVTAALRHRAWLRLHRLAYAGVWLAVLHAWLGAAASGHVAVVWMAGITVLMPAVTLTVLRFLPPHVLVRMGVVEAAPPAASGPDGPVGPVGLRVAVDHARCLHYALCQAQAPRVFRVLDDGRLRYARNPDADQEPQVRAAARACPVRAIRVDAADARR